MSEECDSLPPPRHHQCSADEGFPLQCTEQSTRRRSSAFVFYFSDWWDQTTGGFVLVDLVGHVGAHGLDLNVPGVGIVRFICKPFLFLAHSIHPCSILFVAGLSAFAAAVLPVGRRDGVDG